MKRLHGLEAILSIFLLLSLTACGGGGGSPPQPPVAVAGNPLTVDKRVSVTLDGSGSSDPSGRSLTYAWTQTGGASVVLSSNSSPKPTFSAPGMSGALTFSLDVNNGQLSSPASTVVITVQDRAPVASVPATMTVGAGSQVTLDGSGSSDPDQDTLTYTWTQVNGTSVSLTPGDGGKASFVAPNTPDTLTFTLVVSDGEMSSAAATETITVSPSGVQVPPVASAGSDLTVPKRTLVYLNAVVTHSSGGPLTYQWQQTSGTSVSLQNTNTPNPSFTSPATPGDLAFTLTVTDGSLSSAPSTVTVHVQNYAPVITGVTLSPTAPKRNDPISVTASIADPDSDTLTITYTWTRNGTAVPTATGSSYPLGNQVKGDVLAVNITASDGQLSTSASATTVIVDTPAVLTGSAPTTATYGVSLTFKVTASDVDSDPTGPIEVDYGPAGFSIDSSGQISWTPGGPMLDRTVDVNWGVRLANAPSIKFGGTITVNDPNRKLPMVRSNPGIPVGNNAIDIQDFDGSGSHQILVGAAHSVYLLAKSGSDYQETWVYPFDVSPGNSISAVTSGDVDGDGHREIFFAAGQFIVKLDGITRRETGRYNIAPNTSPTQFGPTCPGLRYADIDNDGAGEIVCLGLDTSLYGGTGKIIVLDAATMQLKWQTADLDLGTSMAVGNVDSDPALEIVTSNGYVFDGATQQNEWLYGSGFGTVVDIGDVNGDGIGKIVALTSGVAARVFDAVNKTPIWEIPNTSVSGESALKVIDLDGTSPAEIIVGDSQWGSVTAYRYDSGTGTTTAIATVPVPGDGVSAVTAGDVNNDGQMELVFGSDYYSSGRDYLTVASWTPTAAALWNGPTAAQLDGPFYGAKLARITPTSQQLMFMTPRSNSGYGGTRVIAIDPATGAVEVSNEVDTNWSADRAFAVGDVLGRGTDQMLIGTATTYTDYFTAYDFVSNTKAWSSGTTTGGGVAVVHADLNNDGIDDLIGITGAGYIYAYDAAHQSLIWSSTGLNSGSDIAVADLDGDGTPEIIALTGTQLIVYARSGTTYLQQATYAVGGSSLLVADTDGDGKPEIYVLSGSSVSSSSSTLYQFDNTLKPLNSYSVPYATSLFLEQSAFTRKNLVIGLSSSTYPNTQPALLNVIDPSSGTVIWASPALLGDVAHNSVAFYDLNADGQLEMTFGTAYGMYMTQ